MLSRVRAEVLKQGAGRAWRRAALASCVATIWALNSEGAGPPSSFEEANRLYEQGRFPAAAEAYEKLIHSGLVSVDTWFNLGNARFKAGQKGAAIAAYRRAGQLAPRDPGVRFNLQHVRKEVQGGAAAPPFWRRWSRDLTLNEWTALAVSATWGFFLLLMAGELRPEWKRGLRGLQVLLAFVSAGLACAVAVAWRQQRTLEAVIVVPEATVRYGPLEESQSFYQLRDGMEVIVLDQNKDWVQVRDASNRPGWVQRDRLILIGPPWKPAT